MARSTVVPSLPITAPSATSPNQPSTNGNERTTSAYQVDIGKIEGWQAVLTTVLRYGIKERLAHGAFDGEADGQELEHSEPVELDTVKAMVDGVKNGGVSIGRLLACNVLKIWVYHRDGIC